MAFWNNSSPTHAVITPTVNDGSLPVVVKVDEPAGRAWVAQAINSGYDVQFTTKPSK